MCISVTFCAIFAVTFACYGLPLKAVAYPAAVCASLALLCVLVDFLRIRKKHLALSRIKTSIDITPENLPEHADLIEEDYIKILRLLQEEQAEYRTKTNRHFDETVDYYTTWVHQIKTPIASMHLTLQSEDTPVSRKLSSELFRIEQYVEMVLVFLRLDSPNSDYLLREYSLDPIIRQSVKKYAAEFIAGKLQLVYTPIETVVLTDEKWLSFVIEQVLSNALKYTPSGSIEIYLESPKTLCIKDTGMGISPEDLPRIFEKGYTGCHGRADKKASGIGLYLCRRICKNLGHEISVFSAPDEGTTVKLDLCENNLEVE